MTESGSRLSSKAEHLATTSRILPYYIPPLASPMTQQVKNPPAMQEMQEMKVQPLGWENPLKEGMATCSSVLA